VKTAAAGYLPKSVIIELDILDPSTHQLIQHICQTNQAKAEIWMNAKRDPGSFDGTVRSLSRVYQTHPSSPYKTVKDTTQRLYTQELRLIESVCGLSLLKSIKAADFTRWHSAAKGRDTNAPRTRKAQGFIKRFRAIVSFGIVAEIAECERLQRILQNLRFEVPARRRSVLTYDMAIAIIDHAHALGKHSIALAQAIQFETGMRQTDVIGQWEPCGPDDRSPYRNGRTRWSPGLTWQNIDADLVLSLDTSKTGSTVTHSLSRMPLVMAEIARIPKDQRIGPVIINDATGLPYLWTEFSKQWRKVADAAGVPRTIWNRDSRAGALSEGDEAGAGLDKLQRMAGHSNSQMTQRYVRGKAVESSAEIADLRTAKRARNRS
jgi:integrase